MKDEAVKKWFEKIEQQKASGKSAAEWCRENGIDYRYFIKWRKRLSASKDFTRSSFIESKNRQDEPWMEITMYGSKLTLTKKFERESMKHLLEVLKGL